MVKAQVESQVRTVPACGTCLWYLLGAFGFGLGSPLPPCLGQIKVRDMSTVAVSLQPAEFSCWQEARTSLMAEKKSSLKAELEAELASVSDDRGLEKLREDFSKTERKLEHDIDHEVHTWARHDANLCPWLPVSVS